MIVYCGLRHFYIHHFSSPQLDAYYILTHNGEIWDFSPELKHYGVTNQSKPKAIFHVEKPVLTIPITLADFQPFSESWHDFSRQYTSELEPEYPHSWYLRFQHNSILEQFMKDFLVKSQLEHAGSICGGGSSKLVAKLAAHNLPRENTIVKPEHTENFLRNIPLHRLPLPEISNLEKLGLKTLGELAEIPLVELTNQFGQRASILQKLGRGEDLTPFQTQQVLEFTWEIDCTTLEGFLRPLTPNELHPYLKSGLEELLITLQCHNKVAGLMKLHFKTPEGELHEVHRRFKTATKDFNVLTRAVDSLIPRQPLAWLKITLGDLQPAPSTQLNMFAEPLAIQLREERLPTQKGVKLPRRERLLLLWEEYFHYE